MYFQSESGQMCASFMIEPKGAQAWSLGSLPIELDILMVRSGFLHSEISVQANLCTLAVQCKEL